MRMEEISIVYEGMVIFVAFEKKAYVKIIIKWNVDKVLQQSFKLL